jgi:hypothetical protein
MSEDDIDKFIKKGTRVAFKFTALEARNVHKLTVPHDVDEVWLEGKMGNPDVRVGGEIKVKITFDRQSKTKMEVQAHDAIEATKAYISKYNEDVLYEENVESRVLLPWTAADAITSGVPCKEELRIAVIEEYIPLFRQYIFKFDCGYKLHVAREKERRAIHS